MCESYGDSYILIFSEIFAAFSDGPTTLCICQDGYKGSGKYCNADMVDTIANASALTDFYQVGPPLNPPMELT